MEYSIYINFNFFYIIMKDNLKRVERDYLNPNIYQKSYRNMSEYFKISKQNINDASIIKKFKGVISYCFSPIYTILDIATHIEDKVKSKLGINEKGVIIYPRKFHPDKNLESRLVYRQEPFKDE